MGIDFVVMVENLAGRTQEEVNKVFPVHECREADIVFPEWELFTYEGKSYANWCSTPRYFFPEDHPKKWEALRKYLVRVREFFGGGDVFLSNDVAYSKDYNYVDDEDERFYLPCKLCEEDLAEPDYEKYPKLKDIKELWGLTW